MELATMAREKRGLRKGAARPVTVGRIKAVLREAEQEAGNGASGATILKLARTPVTRLIETKKIGPVELQAAVDIETAFFALSGALMFRPMNLEKIDRGRHSNWSVKTIDAVERYQNWANHWSKRAGYGDPTLKIAVAAIIDQRPFYQIEEDIGIRHGLAAKVTARVLRDYAARAGWADPHTAARWKTEAGGVFKVAHPGLRMAMMAGDSSA